MKNIASLVESAFSAKRQFGASSEEFKEAQKAAIDEIEKAYPDPVQEIIKTESKVLNADIRIERNKFGCSYVLVNPR